MSVIKCKMCGGDLQIVVGSTVAECEYCGTKQTVPNADNEKKVALFTRANRLRANCEFDKATTIYESIVSEFPEEAEAFWGLVLCKYGIEYVDDPTSGKKIPTCHRSSFESIMDDTNFELTLEYADADARKVYRDEAKVIEGIRKGIIEVSGKEEPYDIFICYKETDEKGNRTLDSVIAQDIYNELVAKGYRVFFSRITLEDKLGQEYEPYIFAALNSAKVMLAVGTDYEYYNAVWVKNEWSRYLKLIAAGQKKTLIPCYKNIDAYDMPKEFAKLQAQDMGKVGAMQDLLRGVEKIMGRDKVKVVVETVKSTVDTAALLKRAFLFLEDGDWKNANEYIEKVLDVEPENGRAYFGKLMIDIKAKTEIELEQNKAILEKSQNYLKALRFCDSGMKEKLESINERNINEQKQLNEAKRAKAKARNKKLLAAIAVIVVLAGISIATVKVGIPAYYENKTQELLAAEQYEDAFVLIRERDPENAEERINQIQYDRAISLLSEENYEESYTILEELGDYRDSKAQIDMSKLNRARKLTEQGLFKDAILMIRSIENHPDAKDLETEIRCLYASELIASKEYRDALDILDSVKTFGDGKKLYQETAYQIGLDYINQGFPRMAADYMKRAGSYKDAPTLMKEQAYLYGSSITNVWSGWFTQKADDLIAYLDLASGYRDARELSLQYKYAYVVDAESYTSIGEEIPDYLLDNCVIALEYTEDLIKANYNGQATRFRAIQSALKTITANVK